MVFNGGYLYFYTGRKKLKYHQKIYVKNSTLSPIENEEFSFSIRKNIKKSLKTILISFFIKENRYEKCSLRCKTQEEYDSWNTILKEKITEFQSYKQYLQNQNNNNSNLLESQIQ